MTREERARHALASVVDTAGRRTYAKLVRLSVDNRDRFGGSEVIAAMIAFADAEAAAMRERCAKAADDAADHEGPFTDYFQGRDQGCHDAATAIRALPATGEVGRG